MKRAWIAMLQRNAHSSAKPGTGVAIKGADGYRKRRVECLPVSDEENVDHNSTLRELWRCDRDRDVGKAFCL